MKTLTLGPSDLSVTQLCYGCMRISGGWERDQVSAAQIEAGIQAVETAWESGITFFDHADIYCDGKSEEIFGSALKRHPEWRKGMVIATKCGIRFEDDPVAGAPHRYDFTKAHILASVERSLRYLGIDTIDLYQLHRPDYLCDPEEVASAFEELRKCGKVRWFGVSNFKPSTVAMLQKHVSVPLISNQVEIHLLRQDCLNEGTLDQCLECDMTPLAWSPVAGGKLGEDREAGADVALGKLHAKMDSIAASYGISRSGLAHAWLLKHPAGIVPIIGSTKPERIKQAAKEADVEISREDWYRLLVAGRGFKLP